MFARLWRRSDTATEKPLNHPARVPDGLRVFAVGDIHGRCDLITKLHRKIHDHMHRQTVKAQNIIVYLGDYVDRGPHSREVIEHLIDFELPDTQKIFLLGNHEEAMLGFLEDTSIMREWLLYGGQATLMSYGVDVKRLKLNDANSVEATRATFAANIPASHRDFLKNLKLSQIIGDYMFVHAGVNPNLPLSEQHRADLLWIRDEFLLSHKPLAKKIVHGHTISAAPEVKANRLGLDTGAYATGTLTCAILERDTIEFLTT